MYASRYFFNLTLVRMKTLEVTSGLLFEFKYGQFEWIAANELYREPLLHAIFSILISSYLENSIEVTRCFSFNL